MWGKGSASQVSAYTAPFDSQKVEVGVNLLVFVDAYKSSGFFLPQKFIANFVGLAFLL